MISLDQEHRYDIPTVGPNTLRNMAQAKLTCLVLHAGWTLIMEPEEFRTVAEKEKIAVIGIEQCRSS